MKQVLVLGGTGAMGIYLVPFLLDAGFRVVVTSRRERQTNHPNLEYVKLDALRDLNRLRDLISYNNFDSIVDFMVYSLQKFKARMKWILDGQRQYIFVSSCRVFADNPPITEDSPKLLDVSADQDYLQTKEYALSKARQERVLLTSRNRVFTVVRPHLTFSRNRFQLVTLEAPKFLNNKVLGGQPVILPLAAMDKQVSMTSGRDVGLMISRLVCNEKSFNETFNITSHEHHSWKDVVDLYKSLIIDNGGNFNILYTDDVKYYLEVNHASKRRYQLIYGRMFDRIMDNSKVLRATGLNKSDITPFTEAMERELIPYLRSRVRSH